MLLVSAAIRFTIATLQFVRPASAATLTPTLSPLSLSPSYPHHPPPLPIHSLARDLLCWLADGWLSERVAWPARGTYYGMASR